MSAVLENPGDTAVIGIKGLNALFSSLIQEPLYPVKNQSEWKTLQGLLKKTLPDVSAA